MTERARPPGLDTVAEEGLKLGARLAMGEVSLLSDGLTETVCHATGTYSIPPRK